MSFQPAELAKLALVLYLAAFLAKKGEAIADFRRGLVPPLAVAGLLARLVLRAARSRQLPDPDHPDLHARCSWPAATRATSRSSCWPRCRRWRWRCGWRRTGCAASSRSSTRGPIRAGSGFQIIQSWLALGNGGIFGQGIGASRQKLFYLPESHTDFIFAILGEELGFVGALDHRRPLRRARSGAGSGSGCARPIRSAATWRSASPCSIATQTLVNLGVVTGLLPTKGLPLPFISFGGSALLVTMLSTGVLLNISQQAHV